MDTITRNDFHDSNEDFSPPKSPSDLADGRMLGLYHLILHQKNQMDAAVDNTTSIFRQFVHMQKSVESVISELKQADAKLQEAQLVIRKLEATVATLSQDKQKLTSELSAMQAVVQDLIARPRSTAPVVTAPTEIATNNYKGALQEYVVRLGYDNPQYSLISRTGADHSPIFAVRVVAANKAATGSGSNKSDAETAAARSLYTQFLSTGCQPAASRGVKDQGLGGFNPYGNGQTAEQQALLPFMFDPLQKCTTGAAVMIFNDQGEVLLIKERPEKKFNLPGGGKQGYETADTTLIRELTEEGFEPWTPPVFMFSSVVYQAQTMTACCSTFRLKSRDVAMQEWVVHRWMPLLDLAHNAYDDVAPYVRRVAQHYLQYLGAKDGGLGGFNPYGNGQTAVAGHLWCGAVVYAYDRSDAVYMRGKWRASPTVLISSNVIPTAGAKITGSVRVSANMTPPQDTYGPTAIVSYALLFHSSLTAFPSYSSLTFDDDGTATTWGAMLTPTNASYRWATCSSFSPTVYSYPWIQPNASGYSFGKPLFAHMGVFALTSDYEPQSEFVPIEFDYPPGLSAAQLYATLVVFSDAGGGTSGKDFVTAAFNLQSSGLQPGSAADYPAHAVTDGAHVLVEVVNSNTAPVPTLIYNNPLNVSLAGESLNLNEPVWVTSDGSASYSATVAARRNKEMHALNGNTMAGPSWLDSVDEDFRPLTTANQKKSVPSAFVTTTDSKPPSDEPQRVRPPSGIDFDAWYEKWFAANKWAAWTRIAYRVLALQESVNADVPDADWTPDTIPDEPAKPRKPRTPADRNSAVRAQGRGERIKTDDEKREAQNKAEVRTCDKLTSVSHYYIWILVRKPDRQWAIRIWKKLGFKSGTGPKHLESLAVSVLDRSYLEVYREWFARLLLEVENTDVPEDQDLDMNLFEDDDGYAEWKARLHNKTMHALVGNTTQASTFWTTEDADKVVASGLITTDSPASLSQMAGLGFAPIPDNTNMVTQNTDLVYQIFTEANAVGATVSVPSFTKMGTARNDRPPGPVGPPAPSVLPLTWSGCRLRPSPLVPTTYTSIATAIEAQTSIGKQLNTTWSTTAFFATDIHTYAVMGTKGLSTDLTPFFLKSWLYRQVTRYNDTTTGRWTPVQEFAGAAFRAQIPLDAQMGLLWGGSPAFDEACGLIPAGAALRPDPVFGPNDRTFTLNITRSSCRAGAQTVVMPAMLTNMFGNEPGKALAMLLMCLLQYPYFIPDITVDTLDNGGGNPALGHFVPAQATHYVPPEVHSHIDILWPASQNVRITQINGAVIGQQYIMNQPALGPVQYEFVPGAVQPAPDELVNVRGTGANAPAAAQSDYYISSFIGSWISEIEEGDWMVFQKCFTKMFNAESYCAKAMRIAQMHSSFCCVLEAAGTDRVQNANFTALPLQEAHTNGLWFGTHEYLRAGAGNVTGAEVPPVANYLLESMSIEYYNAVAIEAVVPVPPSWVQKLVPYASVLGWMNDLQAFRKWTVAAQTWHHANRLSARDLLNPFTTVNPMKIGRLLKCLFVSSGNVTRMAPTFTKFFQKFTSYDMGPATVPSPHTAMVYNTHMFWNTPFPNDGFIVSWIPDVWMNTMMGPCANWQPPPQANTGWQGSNTEKNTWFQLPNQLVIMPSQATHRLTQVPADGWPLMTKQQVGLMRMITAITMKDFPALSALRLTTLAGASLANTLAWPYRPATPTTYPSAAPSFVNCLSYSASSYRLINGIPTMWYYAYPQVGGLTFTQLQRYVAGRDQVNVPTIQMQLDPVPDAYWSGSVNTTVPDSAQIEDTTPTNQAAVPLTAEKNAT